jgi:hypothetical protein
VTSESLSECRDHERTITVLYLLHSYFHSLAESVFRFSDSAIT